MPPRTRTTAVAVGVAALWVAGVAGAALATHPDGATPAPVRSVAHALRPFGDCEALRRWYVDQALPDVGPYGWGGRRWPMAEGGVAVPQSTGRAAPSSGQAASTTGTNTQEVDVDEPDVAKTDGRLVARLEQGRLVLTDVSGSAPVDLGRVAVPGAAEDLLLVGDHVLVTGGATTYGSTLVGTTITDVDVSDPSAPRVARTEHWSGRLVSLRQYGDTVRLVTTDGLPDLPFVQPGGRRMLSPQDAAAANRDVVRASRIQDWLPTRVGDDGRPAPAVACADLLHPARGTSGEPGESQTTVVTTWPVRHPERSSSTGLTAAGDVVYSSAHHLYLTSGGEGTGGPIGPMSPTQGEVSRRAYAPGTTDVHQFDLTASGARYVASGSVDGTVADSWSMDERNGRLRVAVTFHGGFDGTAQHGVVVLQPHGDRLAEVGRVASLGVGEELKSVRWLGDLAVLVTYRQSDPLFTVDLGDPTRPRLLGALHLPGWSSYLHPLGHDQLLGLGTDGTSGSGGDALAPGTVSGGFAAPGAQAAVFDLRDPRAVVRRGQVGFGSGTRLDATADPHAFTWVEDRRTAVTLLRSYADGTVSQLVLLRVGDDGTLTERRLPAPTGEQVRALPLPGDRLAVVGDTVQLVALARR